MKAEPPVEDAHRLLGVAAGASLDEIKRAYRRRARELHPDRNPDRRDAAAAFARLAEAYRRLTAGASPPPLDDGTAAGAAAARAAAAAAGSAAAGSGGAGSGAAGTGGSGSGAAGTKGAGSGTAGTTAGSGAAGSGGGLGGRLRRWLGASEPPPERGEDLFTRLTVELRDIVQASRLRLRLPSSRACVRCAGSGRAEAQSSAPCPACGGSGREAASQQVEIRVPPGAADGDRLQLAGQGEPGLRGGKPGDLTVELALGPHPLLARRGQQLHCRLPLPLPIAIGGGRVTLPGPLGPLPLDIPAGTRNGAELRLAGQGLPPPGGGPRGDLLVTVAVELPRALSTAQRQRLLATLEELAAPDAADAAHYPESRAFRRSAGPPLDDNGGRGSGES
jgi:molecular chaperone DnaJ